MPSGAGATMPGFMGNSSLNGGSPSGFLGGLTGKSAFSPTGGFNMNNMGNLVGQLINMKMQSQTGGMAGSMLSGLGNGMGLSPELMALRSSSPMPSAPQGWTGKGKGARGRSQ